MVGITTKPITSRQNRSGYHTDGERLPSSWLPVDDKEGNEPFQCVQQTDILPYRPAGLSVVAPSNAAAKINPLRGTVDA